MNIELKVNQSKEGNSPRWNWSLNLGDKILGSYDFDLGNLSESALQVAAQLEAFEDDFCTADELAAYKHMFTNSNMMKDDDGKNRPAWILFPANETTPGALEAAAAFYQGVFLYLQEQDRYKSFNAELAYILAAWQWYSATSRLLPKDPKDIRHTNLYRFGLVHQTLSGLLEDSHFDLAAQWMVYFGKPQRNLPLALARERLRIGMVLVQEPIPNTHNEARGLHLPISAPGVHDKVSWGTTHLLSVLFTNEGGRAMVRHLISDWLLVRYDFITSLRLARLLRINKPQPVLRQGWGMLAWLVMWAAGILAINISMQPKPSSLGNTAIIWSGFAFICGPMVILAMGRLWFDSGAMVNLALPRLSGGIALGYVAFILQKDAIDLALRFLEPCIIPLIFLWIGVLILGSIYLYFDVLPRARTRIETCKRTALTLTVALLISMGMGLLMVALSTATYGVCEVSADPSLLAGCFIGPFGWVSWQQWLTLVPLALFTGLVTQFVLEERTVTAPVWSSDES